MSKDEKLGLIILAVGVKVYESAVLNVQKFLGVLFMAVGFYMFIYGEAHLTKRAPDVCPVCGSPKEGRTVVVDNVKVCSVCGTRK